MLFRSQQKPAPVAEAPYADLTGAKIGSSSVDPETGVHTTLTDIDPETGKLSWDVSYDVDPQHIQAELDKLVNYIGETEPGSAIDKIKTILKQVHRQAAKLK